MSTGKCVQVIESAMEDDDAGKHRELVCDSYRQAGSGRQDTGLLSGTRKRSSERCIFSKDLILQKISGRLA